MDEDNPRVHYFRCPYCDNGKGGHGTKMPKQAGEFTVKELYDNVLIFQCKKCKKVCRKLTMGSTLLWHDMSAEEKKVFRKEQFIKYQKGGNAK